MWANAKHIRPFRNIAWDNGRAAQNCTPPRRTIATSTMAYPGGPPGSYDESELIRNFTGVLHTTMPVMSRAERTVVSPTWSPARSLRGQGGAASHGSLPSVRRLFATRLGHLQLPAINGYLARYNGQSNCEAARRTGHTMPWQASRSQAFRIRACRHGFGEIPNS